MLSFYNILSIQFEHKTVEIAFMETKTSPIRPIFIPERARARRADCAPGPGVFVLFPPVARSLICRAVMPSSCFIKTSKFISQGIKWKLSNLREDNGTIS